MKLLLKILAFFVLSGTLAMACDTADTEQTNQTPTITILKPVSGTVFYKSDFIYFACKVSDTEDPVSSLKIEWKENKTLIGDTTSFSLQGSDFTSGAHTIAASVTDTGGKSASATVTITVSDSEGNGGITISF
jgi:hypothetical protein